MSKIEVDWSKAPEWANYHATDKNGYKWWASHIPKKKENGWELAHGVMMTDLTNTHDWELSLRKRPTPSWQPKRFEAVLVRDSDKQNWEAGVFLQMEGELYRTNSPEYGFKWLYCIPLSGNENLLGTNQNP